MKVVHYEQIPTAPVDTEGASGCHIRCLIGQEDRAPHFSMRHFEVAPGGNTPRHRHSHEHEVYVLEGTGVVFQGSTQHQLRPGTAVFVPPQVEHQFRNTGAGTLKFLCLIPHPLGNIEGPCAAACGCD